MGDIVRKWTKGAFETAAGLIDRTGVSANTLTWLGLGLSIGVAYFLAQGYLKVGGVLIILVGILDGLDGALARFKGRASRFGAFLDSTLDRFSEAVIYLGLLIFYTQRHVGQETLLIYATIVGSLMVSYARARAEGLGVECKKGLLTRFERLFVLVCGLILDQTLIALWIVAILSNFTALQRMYSVWQATDGKEERSDGEAQK